MKEQTLRDPTCVDDVHYDDDGYAPTGYCPHCGKMAFLCHVRVCPERPRRRDGRRASLAAPFLLPVSVAPSGHS